MTTLKIKEIKEKKLKYNHCKSDWWTQKNEQQQTFNTTLS